MSTSTIVNEQINTVVIENSLDTNTIVTEANNTVIVQNEVNYAIVAGVIGPTSNSISTMEDVDLTNLADGGLLIYSTSTSKWIAGNLLEKQIIDSGQY